MSWTGSETQRREQGGCSSGGYVGQLTPSYRINEGVEVLVCRVEDGFKHFQPHKLRRPLGFNKHEGYADGLYTFREQGYFVRVHRSRVVHRDGYGDQRRLEESKRKSRRKHRA